MVRCRSGAELRTFFAAGLLYLILCATGTNMRVAEQIWATHKLKLSTYIHTPLSNFFFFLF